MRYNVELTNGGANHARVVQQLRLELKCDMSTAKTLIENAPTFILEDVSGNVASVVRDALTRAGATVTLYEIDDSPATTYTPTVIPANHTSVGVADSARSDDRTALVTIWGRYNKHDNDVAYADNKIEHCNDEIKRLSNQLEELKKEEEKNKKIVDTKGECLRPRTVLASPVYRFFRGFHIFPKIAIAGAIASFVAVLIATSINSEWVTNLAKTLHFEHDGMFAWLGPVCFGAVAGIVGSIGYGIYSAYAAVGINRRRNADRRNYDVQTPYNKAVEFMNNISEHRAKSDKIVEQQSEFRAKIKEAEDFKRSIKPVENNFPMPAELRSAQGVALLLQYIDTGRADNAKEAINLYYQDVKDASRMAELKKQTAYAHQQMINSEIAAENSRRTYAATLDIKDAAERSADAAERSARANEWSSFANSMAADSLRNIERKL